jgi:Uma2 family endonuclease
MVPAARVYQDCAQDHAPAASSRPCYAQQGGVVLPEWIDDDALFEFCALNRDLRIERTANGELWITAPTGGETGRMNFGLLVQLGAWAERDDTGVGFDSSTGFILRNGAERSPDGAWVLKDRWHALAEGERARFPKLVPDFVLELRSPWSATTIRQRSPAIPC